jgi:hypothetical protein
MKIKMMKDWSWYKAGQVVDIYEPLAKNWLQEGVAVPAAEERSLDVERADAVESRVERAVVTEKRKASK